MSGYRKFSDQWRQAAAQPTLATLATLAGGHPHASKNALNRELVYHHTHDIDIIIKNASKHAEGQSEAEADPAAKVAKPAKEPLRLRDGRRLWRWRADTIAPAVSDAARALADEARRFGCVLVADGLDLVVVEPWLSELPEQLRDGLAANAETIIALLRGESRVRTGEGQR